MNWTMNDLFSLIGKQAVEIADLRMENQQLKEKQDGDNKGDIRRNEAMGVNLAVVDSASGPSK